MGRTKTKQESRDKQLNKAALPAERLLPETTALFSDVAFMFAPSVLEHAVMTDVINAFKCDRMLQQVEFLSKSGK